MPRNDAFRLPQDVLRGVLSSDELGVIGTAAIDMMIVPPTRRKNWPPKHGTEAWYRYENERLSKRIADLEAEIAAIKEAGP